MLVKDISRDITVVRGPHASAFPYETMKESMIDVVFVGEADYSFAEYCEGKDPKSILGIYFDDNGEPTFTGWRPMVGNLDDLTMLESDP